MGSVYSRRRGVKCPALFFVDCLGELTSGRFSGIGGFGEEKRTELRCMRFSYVFSVLVLERLKHRHFQWIALQIATDETGRRSSSGIYLRLPSQLPTKYKFRVAGCGRSPNSSMKLKSSMA